MTMKSDTDLPCLATQALVGSRPAIHAPERPRKAGSEAPAYPLPAAPRAAMRAEAKVHALEQEPAAPRSTLTRSTHALRVEPLGSTPLRQ